MGCAHSVADESYRQEAKQNAAIELELAHAREEIKREVKLLLLGMFLLFFLLLLSSFIRHTNRLHSHSSLIILHKKGLESLGRAQ